MIASAILLYVALYVGVILCGLAAGVAVNALADRVAPTPGPSPDGRGEVLGERGDESERDHQANAADLALRQPASPHDPLPVGEGRERAVRRWATPLVLGALFPLLLAHALAVASHAPAQLPVWGVIVTQAVCVAVLAGVFVIDLEHRLIFDVTVFPLGVALLALALLADRRALPALALGAILAGGIFLLFYGLGFLLYRQEAMGFGDVKLAALVGLIVGWPAITTALLATAIVGAIASMLLLAFSDISRRAFIPFGVFLAVGAVVALLAAPPVW